jgi:hypothetical protein
MTAHSTGSILKFPARPLATLACSLFAALTMLLPNAASALHVAGTEVSVSAQFGAANDSDSSLSFSSTSITSPSFPGEAFASAQYDGALRVTADSAPDGVGASIGDSMVGRAKSSD